MLPMIHILSIGLGGGGGGKMIRPYMFCKLVCGEHVGSLWGVGYIGILIMSVSNEGGGGE